MNKNYLLSFVGVMLNVAIASSQSIQTQQSLSETRSIKTKDFTAPFIGVSIAIPLSKFLRAKNKINSIEPYSNPVTGRIEDRRKKAHAELDVSSLAQKNETMLQGATVAFPTTPTQPIWTRDDLFSNPNARSVGDRPHTNYTITCAAYNCFYECQGCGLDYSDGYNGAYAHNEGHNYECEQVVFVNNHTYTLNDYTVDYSGCTPPPPPDNPPGGGGGGGPAGALDHQYAIEPLNCEAYNALNSYASSYGKEYGAVITTDNHLIILPAAGNAINKTDFGGVYQDEQGRTILTIYQENGNWYVQCNVYYYDGTNQNTVYQISGMVHTHPIGTAPNGQPWDTYNPSGDDLNLLNSYPGLNQYISAPDKTFQFNSSGTVPNSSAPNSNC